MELVSTYFSTSCKVFSNHSDWLEYFSTSGFDSWTKGVNSNLNISLLMTPTGSYYHLKLLLNLKSFKHLSACWPTFLLLQMKGPSWFSILNWVLFFADRKLISFEFRIFFIYSNANNLIGRYLGRFYAVIWLHTP